MKVEVGEPDTGWVPTRAGSTHLHDPNAAEAGTETGTAQATPTRQGRSEARDSEQREEEASSSRASTVPLIFPSSPQQRASSPLTSITQHEEHVSTASCSNDVSSFVVGVVSHITGVLSPFSDALPMHSLIDGTTAPPVQKQEREGRLLPPCRDRTKRVRSASPVEHRLSSTWRRQRTKGQEDVSLLERRSASPTLQHHRRFVRPVLQERAEAHPSRIASQGAGSSTRVTITQGGEKAAAGLPSDSTLERPNVDVEMDLEPVDEAEEKRGQEQMAEEGRGAIAQTRAEQTPIAIPPSPPPRRQLRARKAAQLKPYTTEMERYKRRLIRNDWQDALVANPSLLRALRERRKEEEGAQAANMEASQFVQEAIEERRKQRRARRDKDDYQRHGSRQRRQNPEELARGSKSNGKDREEERPHKQKRLTEEEITAIIGPALSSSDDGENDDDNASDSGEGEAMMLRNRQHSAVDDTGTNLEMAGFSDRNEIRSNNIIDLVHETDGQRSCAAEVNEGEVGRGEGDEEDEEEEEEEEEGGEGSSHLHSHLGPLGGPRKNRDPAEYDKLFRYLRRMMPIGQARRYIEDVKAMDREYEEGGGRLRRPRATLVDGEDAQGNRQRQDASRSASPSLRPGQAKKKAPIDRRQHVDDGRFDLVGDPEDEDNSPSALATPSSLSHDDESWSRISSPLTSVFDGQRTGPGDHRHHVIGEAWPVSVDSSDEEVDEDDDESLAAWWVTYPQSRLAARKGKKVARRAHVREDEIDRMLTRAATTTKRRHGDASGGHRRQRDPAPKPRTKSRKAMARMPRPEARRTLAPARPRGNLVAKARPAARSPRMTGIPSGITTARSNPPVVEPRQRRLLSFDDDGLFEAASGIEPTMIETGAGTKATRQPRLPLSALVPRQDHNLQGFSRGEDSPVTKDNKMRVPHQTHLDDHLRKSSRAASPQGQIKVDEAETWADLGDVRIDFDILPPPLGMSFAPDTYLGKGRLHELLHFEDKQPKPQFTSIFGVDFDPTTFDMCRQGPEVATAMDAIFDEVCKQLTLSQESLQDVQWPLRMIRTRAADLLRFLNLAMSSLEGQESPSDIRKTAYWLANRIDHLLERLRLGLCESQKRFKGDVFRLQLTLRWAKVELFWRVRALCLDGARDDLRDGLRDGLDEDDDVEGSLDAACRQVMLSLLVHGFHRTMKGYKGACERQRGGSTCGVEETGFRDESAETWVCLIHLLSKCRFNLQDRFWGVFDEAYQQYQALFSAKARSSVGQAEATWFIIYALCALSRFSASIGASSTKSPLEANWSLVGKVVGSVKLRFDDHVESKLSSRALRKRDGYIRIILARILLLAQRAAWKFEGAEAMLAALFQIFESHRLADLPTDEEHDFAPFLYRYDDSALYSIDDTERIGGESAFQTFLCILAWAARDLKQGADAGAGQGGDRMVSRLFSRMTPVRIMDFTRQRPPTNHERSSLFNHYSIAMLNLHLVPSAHVQRFRQIRSFLAFEKADWRSQLACIRAMMYAAVLYQHHNLDVGPVASWFSSILRSLLADFDELQRTRPEPGQSFAYGRRVGEVTNLLKASLRSVQYVIRDPGLRHTCQHEEESRRIRYPDVSLIDPAWTEKLFDSQAIMSADIAREAFACLWRFLEARSEAVHEAAMTSSTVQPAAAQDEDSQDSYAELFDEVDFDDPALARMLDIGTEAMADAAPPTSSQRQEEQDGILVRQKDREFAELIACRISPAIFRFITNSLHPDRIGSRAYVLAGSDDEEDEELEEVTKDDDGEEQRQSLEAAIDVWVSFASVVVASSSGARSWVGYVNFGGKESFKNLSHGIHKREVGLRFLWNVLHLLEQDNELDRFDELSKDMWSIWFASIVARRLSVVLQDFTAMLAKMDVKLFEGSNFRDDGEKSLENFKKTRLDLLLCILENVDKTLANDKDKVVAQRVVGGLSSLLSSLRIYVEEVISSSAEGKGHTRGKDYVDFSGRVLSALERKVANEEVKRGIKTELGRTKAAVQRAQEIV